MEWQPHPDSTEKIEFESMFLNFSSLKDWYATADKYWLFGQPGLQFSKLYSYLSALHRHKEKYRNCFSEYQVRMVIYNKYVPLSIFNTQVIPNRWQFPKGQVHEYHYVQYIHRSFGHHLCSRS
jgi:hypothetical protein